MSSYSKRRLGIENLECRRVLAPVLHFHDRDADLYSVEVNDSSDFRNGTTTDDSIGAPVLLGRLWFDGMEKVLVDIAFSPETGILYGVSDNATTGDQVSFLYRIRLDLALPAGDANNPNSFAIIPIEQIGPLRPLSENVNVTSLTFDNRDTDPTLYAAGESLYAITDITTGEAQFAGGNSTTAFLQGKQSLGDLAFTSLNDLYMTAVPTPSTPDDFFIIDTSRPSQLTLASRDVTQGSLLQGIHGLAFAGGVFPPGQNLMFGFSESTFNEKLLLLRIPGINDPGPGVVTALNEFELEQPGRDDIEGILGASFQIPDIADTSAPTVNVSADSISVTAGTFETFDVVVELSDDRGVLATTIGDDLLIQDVSLPANPLVFDSVSFTPPIESPDNGRATVTATYRYRKPGGLAWAPGDAGAFRITAIRDGITDINGLGNFQTQRIVNLVVNAVADVGPTAAIMTSNAMVSPASSETISVLVQYSDTSAILGINGNDLSITGQGNVLQFSSVTTTVNAAGALANYRFSKNSPWTSADSGNYSVTVNADSVSDSGGNLGPAADVIGSLTLSVGTVGGVGGPTAVINLVNQSVTAGTTTAVSVSVNYLDPQGIDLSTVGVSDVSIPGLTPVNVRTVSIPGGTQVTYDFVAPAAWAASDAGTYTINVAAGVVADVAGNTGPVSALSGSFQLVVDSIFARRNLFVRLNGGALELVDADTLAVVSSVPANSTQPLTITGSDQADAIRFFTLPGVRAPIDVSTGDGDDTIRTTDYQFRTLDAGAGVDSLTFDNVGANLDFTSMGAATFTGVESVNIDGAGSNSVTLNPTALAAQIGASSTMSLRYRADDSATLGTGWMFGTPGFVDNRYVHRLQSGALTLLVDNDNPYQNPVTAADVGRDGSVAPIDALLGINQLNRTGVRVLPPVTPGGELPAQMFDVNGDGSHTPIDSLIVLNFINRGGAASPEGESRADGLSTLRENLLHMAFAAYEQQDDADEDETEIPPSLIVDH